MSDVINKTMDRDDLLTEGAAPVIEELNSLLRHLRSKGLYVSSWVGTVPPATLRERCQAWWDKVGCRLGRKTRVRNEDHALELGMSQRLDYEPLAGAADDLRIPWFLYWEICSVMKVVSPHLPGKARCLDGGGTSSLFSCYLASLGHEVHSVDLSGELKSNADRIVARTGWDLHSYCMDLGQLSFPDTFFDHAFSICVFEHLDFDVKQKAMAEVARCLKPGGLFCLTFDYRSPAPGVYGYGKDPRPRNQLKSEEDIRRCFLGTDKFEIIGNQDFHDNGKNYLDHPVYTPGLYTFGSLFLRKRIEG